MRTEEEVANDASESAKKCKAAHDEIMDRIAELVIDADEFGVLKLAQAVEHALAIFKPKVVWA